LNLAILSIVVAGASAVYAQDDKPQDRPARPEEPKAQEEAKPEPKQDEMKPPRQDDAKPEKQGQKQDEKQSREDMKDNRQPASQQDAHARPAGKGGHIPDDKFHSNFGRGHTFVVQRTTIVQGQSGFVYGGYSFGFVDPWPAGWAYTDDCYVDYIDGEYFLFDLLHPGVRIALFVVM
jgi:hypothetical protein